MRKEFYKNLFLPISIVIIWWLLIIPSIIFPQLKIFTSFFYKDVFPIVILGLSGILLIYKLIHLIFKKQYILALAILLGVPIALIFGYLSIILLIGFSGI